MCVQTYGWRWARRSFASPSPEKYLSGRSSPVRGERASARYLTARFRRFGPTGDTPRHVRLESDSMFIISVRSHYDAAHFLREYQGKCERLHGHRYEVEAALAFEDVGRGGIAYDFADAKRLLREIADELDHQNLNDLPAFAEIETSAENQARYIYETLKGRLGEAGDNLLYVRVWETPNQWAQYSERLIV